MKWEMRNSDSEDEVLLDRSKADKSLMAIATELVPNQKFEEQIFVDGGGLVYDVDEMTLTGTEMSTVGSLHKRSE